MLNAAETEIVSLSSAAQECLFLCKLCIEMGFHQHRPTFIYEDCEAAVALSEETRFRNRSNYIALRWHLSLSDKVPAETLRPPSHPPASHKDACIFASSRAAPTFIVFRDPSSDTRSSSWLMTTSNHSLIYVRMRGRTRPHHGSQDPGLCASAIVSDVASQAPQPNNLPTVIALIARRRDTLSQINSKASTQLQYTGLR